MFPSYLPLWLERIPLCRQWNSRKHSFQLGWKCVGTNLLWNCHDLLHGCRYATLSKCNTATDWNITFKRSVSDGTDCEKEGQTENSSLGENGTLLDLYVVHEGTLLLPRIEEHERECFMIGSPYAHYGCTVVILAFSFLGAIKAPSLAIIWNFCGPTLAFLISFLLPAACYLEIQRREPGTHFLTGLFAWFLIIFSVVAAIACTIQTICISFDWPLSGEGTNVHNSACSQQQSILWLPCSSWLLYILLTTNPLQPKPLHSGIATYTNTNLAH